MSQFRERARKWLAANARSFPDGDQYEVARAVQGEMHAAGFAGINVPREYGGQGLTDAERRAWDEEAQAYQIPTHPLGIGLGMVVPILLDLGTEEQKRRYVPPLVRGEWLGCQLFSEPGAGSDVASLATRAVPDGDGWVINGQKVWTSHAHQADVGILLARTNRDVPKHQGITMFVVDMLAPGVTVRPLRDMTGDAPFNEVFFDDLRVPSGAVVGRVDEGWLAAIRMLRHERIAIGNRMQSVNDPASFQALVKVARQAGRAGDPIVRQDLVEVFIGQRLGELFAARIVEEIKAGADPGPRGSIGKLAGGRQAQLLTRVIGSLAGPAVTAWPEGDEGHETLARILVAQPRYRIAGGTDEIQRNIIAERVLGLPKERA
jgi:alkylation response protein AidB-like acyl-CoA dehydrogenase